jgi:alkyl hydroperoxide reductase subunit AhpC
MSYLPRAIRYPVLKKWLSYREVAVLGRALRADEVRYFAEMVRRIVEILAMGPALDASYQASRACAVAWEDGRPTLS